MWWPPALCMPGWGCSTVDPAVATAAFDRPLYSNNMATIAADL